MKILYIDPISPKGHIGFNSIHTRALMESFGNVDVVFEYGYKSLSEDIKGNLIYEYPIISVPNNGLFNRYRIWRNFKNIQKKIDFSIYDVIIVASYDEIALNFLRIKQKLYLINHNNIAGVLHNKIKWFFFKRLTKRHIPLVFDSLSQKMLFLEGIENVRHINHGVKSPFVVEKDWSLERIGVHKKYKNILFSPSDGSSDKNFLNKIIINSKFTDLLEKSNSLFICRNLKIEDESLLNKNIINITQRLSNDDYLNLFYRSTLIIISYPSSFLYRTSGVLMEALANNKDILIPSIPGFNIYNDIINKSDFYSSEEEFFIKLKEKINSPSRIVERYISDIAIPDYSFLNL